MELGTDGLPERPIGVADYKNVDFRKACVESFGYSTGLMQNRCNDETFVAQLVFPALKDWIKLELHVGLSEKVLVIEISEVSLHSSEVEVGSFFHLLYAAVHFFLENPIKSQLPCCSPTRSLCLSMSDCLGSKEIPHVFVVDDKVYKLFDTMCAIILSLLLSMGTVESSTNFFFLFLILTHHDLAHFHSCPDLA